MGAWFGLCSIWSAVTSTTACPRSPLGAFPQKQILLSSLCIYKYYLQKAGNMKPARSVQFSVALYQETVKTAHVLSRKLDSHQMVIEQ